VDVRPEDDDGKANLTGKQEGKKREETAKQPSVRRERNPARKRPDRYLPHAVMGSVCWHEMATPCEIPSDACAAPFVLAAEAMGTRFEFVLAGGDAALLRAAGEEALDEVLSLHDRLSAFSQGSVVSLLNEHAWERPVRVAGDVFDLLRLCRRIWEESNGAFDPTIGELMRLWGFRGGTRRKPSESEVDAARDGSGMHLVELDDERCEVYFRSRGVRLDLGAVAKGWALDAAASVLRERGVRCALMHGGTSSVLTIGAPPELEGWGVSVVHPAGGKLNLALRDEALGVSGAHGRMVKLTGGGTDEEGEQDFGHVLNPRTGRPLAPDRTERSVGSSRMTAVKCGSAAEADAWSTALLVLGARAVLAQGMSGWLCDGGDWRRVNGGNR
jgi:thiamine biosynthesis lipoprotein